MEPMKLSAAGGAPRLREAAGVMADRHANALGYRGTAQRVYRAGYTGALFGEPRLAFDATEFAGAYDAGWRAGEEAYATLRGQPVPARGRTILLNPEAPDADALALVEA